MDSEALPLLVLGGFMGFLLPVTALGAAVLVRDTVRRRGRWGINIGPLSCPECAAPAPVVRSPRNLRQALWGGCTCAECGIEYDKWGEAVDKSSSLMRDGLQES